MYRRLIVPLDGSTLGEYALPYAVAFARAFKPDVVLLRAFQPVPEQWAKPEHGVYLDRLLEATRSDIRDYLERASATFKGSGAKVACVVHEGDPAAHILAEAEAQPDTLVVMSTHGRSGLTRWTLGSVTDKIVRASTAPVLVVGPRVRHPAAPDAVLGTVITPLDGSSVAEQALPHASDIAMALGLDLVLVRVSVTVTEMARTSGVWGRALDDLYRDLDLEAETYLLKVKERLTRDPHPLSVTTQVCQGSPADLIKDLAEQTPGALVVMTTHGRSGAGRLLLGSVADRVVRQVEAPVLLVRAQTVRE